MGGVIIIPKKQSATRVKHCDLEKKKEDYWKKGIGVDLFQKVRNPHPIEFCKVYKRIIPEPENNLDIELARASAEEFDDVRFEKWDASRRDEISFSRKAYMFVAEYESDKIDELASKIEQAEKLYNLKREEMKKKITKPLAIAKVLTM